MFNNTFYNLINKIFEAKEGEGGGTTTTSYREVGKTQKI